MRLTATELQTHFEEWRLSGRHFFVCMPWRCSIGVGGDGSLVPAGMNALSSGTVS
jgi:hypothetical protein